MSGGKPAREVKWAAARRDYESSRDSMRMVAERHGVSVAGIKGRRRREGWKRESEKRGVDWEKVRAEYENGEFSTMDICERHGINLTSLYKRRREEGWKARRVSYPKSVGPYGEVNAERLKALLARELSSIEARLRLKDTPDASEPLRAVHTVASAMQKFLDIERKEKDADDAGRTGRLVIDDASRLALAERLETLARRWETDGEPSST